MIPSQTREEAQTMWERIDRDGRASVTGSHSCLLCGERVFVTEGDMILHQRCQSVLITRRHRRGQVGF